MIVAASAVWSTMGIFGKLAFAYPINPVTLIALRLLISFSALFIPVALFKRNLLKVQKKDLLLLIILGIFATAFQRIAYFYAIHLTTVSMAAILFYTYPVFVTLYAAKIHKEKITSSIILAILLSMSGVFLVVKGYALSSLSANITGIIFGLLSSVLFVLFFFATKSLRATYKNWTLLIYGDGIGALILLPVILRHSSEIIQYPAQLWLLIFAIACFSSLVGYLLYTYALKYVQASKASILSVTEPLFAALLSVLLLQESLQPPQIIGIILALLGVALANGLMGVRS
jgi:drug/metabolite transporter (DMT)-like permease